MASETSRVIDDLNKFVRDLVVDVAVTVTKVVADDNPELTGHSQSNWTLQIGAPVEQPFGSKEAVDTSAQASSIALIQTTYRLPNVIYISNPVDYISSLNAGSSAKAPRNFVQTAIAKAIKSVV